MLLLTSTFPSRTRPLRTNLTQLLERFWTVFDSVFIVQVVTWPRILLLFVAKTWNWGHATLHEYLQANQQRDWQRLCAIEGHSFIYLLTRCVIVLFLLSIGKQCLPVLFDQYLQGSAILQLNVCVNWEIVITLCLFTLFSAQSDDKLIEWIRIQTISILHAKCHQVAQKKLTMYFYKLTEDLATTTAWGKCRKKIN
jgi:hypothetical protein